MALFLGAGRASLVQLAHPSVATALDHHSNLRSYSLARFHNTFKIVFTTIFGTQQQALAASRAHPIRAIAICKQGDDRRILKPVTGGIPHRAKTLATWELHWRLQ